MSAIFVTLDWISESFRRRIANQRLEGDCHCGLQFQNRWRCRLGVDDIEPGRRRGNHVLLRPMRRPAAGRAGGKAWRRGALTPRREKFAQGVNVRDQLSQGLRSRPRTMGGGLGEAAQRA